jgi:ABC-type sugar transport system ATPase subunit
MSDNFVEFLSVRKSFGGTLAVEDLSLAAPRGHIRAVLGENGAGKSTLIKMLCGVYPPDQGDILVEGKRVNDLSPAEALGAGIVAIYQEFNLVPQLTVAQNIFLGRFPVRYGLISASELRQRTRTILERLSAPIDPDALVGDLGIAQQQIVEIAKAISRDLKVLVMDEPTAALNDGEVKTLFSVIRGLRDRGVCVFYISHRMSEIFSLADSVSVLKDGRHVGTRDIAEVDRDSLVRMMIGRDLNGYFPPKGKPSGDVILLGKALRLGDSLNVGRIEIRRGEIVGLAGLEGQGQRQLVKAICGALPLDSGTVLLEGEALDLSSPRATIAASVGFIPDDRKGEGLALMHSCRDNVALESLDLRRSFGFFVNRRQESLFVHKMVDALSIRLASPFQPARDLSGGNQQKLVLAKVLGIEPKVIILAEPTRGVDVGAKREIYNIMRELADRGVGILMMSGELPEILGMSDRILVMAGGEIAAELLAGDASEEKIMHAATREPIIAGAQV